MNYGVYYGAQRDLDKTGACGLILTTYGIVRQDLALLQELTFDVIILDEIQYLKNRTTATHRAVAALNGRVVVGLKGTPIENSLQDLYSLFDICLPGLLGSERRFNNLYVQPVVEEGSRQAKQMLSSLIRPFILRRNRQQVLTELPDIIEDNRIERDLARRKGQLEQLEDTKNEELAVARISSHIRNLCLIDFEY